MGTWKSESTNQIHDVEVQTFPSDRNFETVSIEELGLVEQTNLKLVDRQQLLKIHAQKNPIKLDVKK